MFRFQMLVSNVCMCACVCFHLPPINTIRPSRPLPSATGLLQQGNRLVKPFSPICRQSGLIYRAFVSFSSRAINTTIFFSLHDQSKLLIQPLIALWGAIVFKYSSVSSVSSTDECLWCCSYVCPCTHSALFDWLQEEYQASLIKTKYWISRVMNVHCRLIEVNAASAPSEHLSYLKGNGLQMGLLWTAWPSRGNSVFSVWLGLAFSLL